MLGTWDKIIENMRKEELIKQLQEREPLLANAVSHMVEYIQDRYPAAYPSKEQTVVCQKGIANTAVSLHRTSPLPPYVCWTVNNWTGCKTYLTTSHMTRSIICRREDTAYTADFLFWLHQL